MSGTLFIRNRQRQIPVNAARFSRILRSLLRDHLGWPSFDLGIYLVGATEMTRLNETHLGHEGSTDVITFDYADQVGKASLLHGEIFICVDEAVIQARRFRVTWQSELVRYAIHGILHLLGHDDSKVAARRKMKQEENRLLKEIAGCFELKKL